MGREANVFDLDKITYRSLMNAIKEKNNKQFTSTIEFYPEEGKYHFDGHRNCNFSVDPAKEKDSICPICRKRLTIGVLHRINDLSDRPEDYVPKNAIPFVHIVPLIEIIAYVDRKNTFSRAVVETNEKMLKQFGEEFKILMDVPIAEISETFGSDIAHAIDNVRTGKVKIIAGYDGVFGKVDLLNREEKKATANKVKQTGLSKFLDDKKQEIRQLPLSLSRTRSLCCLS